VRKNDGRGTLSQERHSVKKRTRTPNTEGSIITRKMVGSKRTTRSSGRNEEGADVSTARAADLLLRRGGKRRRKTKEGVWVYKMEKKPRRARKLLRAGEIERREKARKKSYERSGQRAVRNRRGGGETRDLSHKILAARERWRTRKAIAGSGRKFENRFQNSWLNRRK